MSEPTAPSPVFAEVTQAPLSLDHHQKQVSAPGCGAVLTFVGVVRDLNDGRKVRAVSYDAFVPLAEATLREIAAEAVAEFGAGVRVAVSHRVGKLEVGEASVMIAVASPHRDESYRASRYVIEEIKKRLPVWKQEHYVDGDSEWVRGHSLCRH